jgi:hypothetical protein
MGKGMSEIEKWMLLKDKGRGKGRGNGKRKRNKYKGS